MFKYEKIYSFVKDAYYIEKWSFVDKENKLTFSISLFW
ncbi:MAG: hypothetical protein ACD_3C00056G0001 [uncultured bacterium (gcode 4)]|uniref:Uncharacterized protein n=1 Tax=uncultured bacterium (gcode 4) TaxID=1234023 RepID=K2G2H5_9BACT|nr:MAG: hypothetical protein ACD_3C00056G0001 [uncultured bacterium (gcode 4)]